MKTKNIQFRQDTNRIETIKQGDTLEVKGIVLMRDLPMNFFYIPPEVFGESLSLWAGVPIVAPTHIDETIESNIFGQLTAAYIDGDKLKANGIINTAKLLKHFPILHNKLIAGQAINGSVDILVNGLSVTGQHQNREYKVLVTDILKANHYAMLQDEPGACSIADKCGFNVAANNLQEVEMTAEQLKEILEENGKQVAEAVKAEFKLQTNPVAVTSSHLKQGELSQLVSKLSCNVESLQANLQASEQTLTASLAETKAENELLTTKVNELTEALAKLKANAPTGSGTETNAATYDGF